ncbi:GNAT family N-acetyltransferase [Escherichia coli]|nr:GNAT family N-acetyltransferase [Escherichia coli]EFB9662036.1 GNAT family N-acetyltransferase [Escherichia coli]
MKSNKHGGCMSLTVGSASEIGISVDDICNFYDQNWPRKIALSDATFYKWQFVNNPVNHGIDDCCVATDGSEIVGIMGLNARDFFAKSRKMNGAELTTWVVAEKHRNKGSGPAMIDYLKGKYEVMTGMGISLQALPVYLRSGFRYVKSIPRYVHVIDWDRVSGYIKELPLARKYARSQFRTVSFSVAETTEEAVNSIYSEFSKSHNSFSRNYGDVKWRFDDNPYFKYHHFIVGGCFVSVRIDKGIDGFVMAHCVDIFGDEKYYQQAISAAIHYAIENGAHAVDFFSTNSTLNANLSSMGLFSTLDHDFFTFPHLFHPVEIRTPATTSLILWSKEGMTDLLDVSNLHITKQDADFDRPTIHGMKK